MYGVNIANGKLIISLISTILFQISSSFLYYLGNYILVQWFVHNLIILCWKHHQPQSFRFAQSVFLAINRSCMRGNTHFFNFRGLKLLCLLQLKFRNLTTLFLYYLAIPQHSKKNWIKLGSWIWAKALVKTNES